MEFCTRGSTIQYQDIFLKHFAALTIQAVCVSIFALCLAILVELAVVGKARSILCRLLRRDVSKSVRQDLAVWLLDVSGTWLLLGKVLTFGITFYLAAFFNSRISEISTIKFLEKIKFVPLQIIVFLLLADLVGYWLHRTFHTLSPLWRLHRFHHSATEMSIFTARRDNPLVVPTFVLFTQLPVALFGNPGVIPLWVTFISVFHALLIHSQVRSNWGFFGKWVMVSPEGHKIHHSIQEAHFDKNFAFMFPIWDHVFGSYYRGQVPAGQIGVPDVHVGSMFSEIKYDTSQFFRLLFRRQDRTRK